VEYYLNALHRCSCPSCRCAWSRSRDGGKSKITSFRHQIKKASNFKLRLL